MVKIKIFFLPALLWLTVFALLPSKLHAQSDLTTRIIEYRETIINELNSITPYIEAWKKSLSSSNNASKETAFENLENAVMYANLHLYNMPILEGDTSLMKRAGEFTQYMRKQCRDNLGSIQLYATTHDYLRSEKKDAEYQNLLSNVEVSIRHNMNKVLWAERELVASLLIKPQSEEFCYSFSAMLPETQAAFPNLKGDYLNTTQLGFEKYEATQLFNMAKSGAVYISDKKQYAEFLMAESADSTVAVTGMNELACYIMCCDLKGFGRVTGDFSFEDKATIVALEFPERQTGAMRITSTLRRDDKYGPYQVYLQFWKLK